MNFQTWRQRPGPFEEYTVYMYIVHEGTAHNHSVAAFEVIFDSVFTLFCTFHKIEFVELITV